MIKFLLFPFIFLSTNAIGYDGLFSPYSALPPYGYGRMVVPTGQPAPSSPTIPEDLLRSTMKMQSTHVAETTLSGHNHKGCFMRTVCAVGTLKEEETPQFSMAQGIQEFRKLLEEMVVQMKDDKAGKQQIFPNIHKTLASFQVGSSTNDLKLCEQLFPCQSMSAEELVSDALVSPGSSLRQGRATCVAAGNLCPGVSIGCSLCGIFLDSTCSLQCTIAGMYCGISGYACRAEAEEAVTKAMEKFANDEDKQKEFMKFMFGDLAEHMEA